MVSQNSATAQPQADAAEARALREALRELLRGHNGLDVDREAASATLDAVARTAGLDVRFAGGAIRFVPRKKGADRRPRAPARRGRPGDGRRLVAAPEGVQVRHVPVGVHRQRPQPLAPVVRHGRMRQPRQGAHVQVQECVEGCRSSGAARACGVCARRVVRRPCADRALQRRRGGRHVGDDVRGLRASRHRLRARRGRGCRSGRRRGAPLERAVCADRDHDCELVPRHGAASARRGAARRRRVLGARRRRHAALRPSRAPRCRLGALGRLGGRHRCGRAARPGDRRPVGVRPRRRVRRALRRAARSAADRAPPHASPRRSAR